MVSHACNLSTQDTGKSWISVPSQPSLDKEFQAHIHCLKKKKKLKIIIKLINVIADLHLKNKNLSWAWWYSSLIPAEAGRALRVLQSKFQTARATKRNSGVKRGVGGGWISRENKNNCGTHCENSSQQMLIWWVWGFETVSFCSPGWPQTQKFSCSASHWAGLQAWVTISGQMGVYL